MRTKTIHDCTPPQSSRRADKFIYSLLSGPHTVTDRIHSSRGWFMTPSFRESPVTNWKGSSESQPYREACRPSWGFYFEVFSSLYLERNPGIYRLSPSENTVGRNSANVAARCPYVAASWAVRAQPDGDFNRDSICHSSGVWKSDLGSWEPPLPTWAHEVWEAT